jgi:hypothetical protein
LPAAATLPGAGIHAMAAIAMLSGNAAVMLHCGLHAHAIAA